MRQCSECEEKFPDDLVQPLCINGEYTNVCGVCALNIIKELYNIPSYQFIPGSIARDIYDRAKNNLQLRQNR